MNAPANSIQLQQPLPVTMGFASMESFEFLQRAAKAFINSTMVPTAYQATVEKGYGQNKTIEPNPAAMSNCIVALDMAQRMNAAPLMIMQNLHIIEGRPSWSSPFIIAMINQCGRFSPLQFQLDWLGEIEATHTTFEWVNKQKQERVQTVRLRNARCVAWAVERGTKIPQFPLEELRQHGSVYGCMKHYGIPLIESAPVTMEMAVNEGWYTKNGSKWKTMPDQMLRYRCAAFFGRIYTPELLMGLPTEDEIRDVFVQGDGGAPAYAGQQPVPPSSGRVDPATGEIDPQPPTTYPEADFAKGMPAWVKAIVGGKKTLEDVVATLNTKALITTEQRQRLEAAVSAAMPLDATPKDTAQAPAAERADWDKLADQLRAAKTSDDLYAAADFIDTMPQEHRTPLIELFNARLAELEGPPQ